MRWLLTGTAFCSHYYCRFRRQWWRFYEYSKSYRSRVPC